MAEYTARAVLAANLARLMEETPALDTPDKLSKRCFWPAGKKKGKRVAPRTIRYALDTREDAVPPIPSPTLDLIAALAGAFGIPPWHMLVDDEEARRWVVSRLLIGKSRPDPVAPPITKMPAASRRKRKRT